LILILEWFVLTSAHCVKDALYVNAYLGAQTSQFTFDGLLIDKKHITLHEKYDPKTQENDLALIELPSAAKLCHNVQIAELPVSERENFDSKPVTVAGWGREGNLGQVAAKLKFTNMSVITNKDCEKKLGLKALKPSQICAQGGPNKNSLCLGDSGGALIVKASNTVVGIVGPTPNNCESGLPVVVTRVALFLDWIEKRINKCE
jgi:secreted trypsin-like serine protease